MLFATGSFRGPGINPQEERVPGLQESQRRKNRNTVILLKQFCKKEMVDIKFSLKKKKKSD